jgi:hypothetical protein
MTNYEARNAPNASVDGAQIPAQNQTVGGDDSAFGFRASFVIRHSSVLLV